MNHPTIKAARDIKAIRSIARDEVCKWKDIHPPGIVMAILFAFCHRLTTGETIEELLDKCSGKEQELDYQI